LVVYDTLRADRMSIYGHDRPTTPFLEEIADELVVYDDAKAPASWTLPSHVSLFTGLLPVEHGAHWGHKSLDESFLTLAEALESQGFCTLAFSSNPMLNRRFGFYQGFDRFRRFGKPEATRTERLLDELESELDGALERDCRLFVFLNLMDAHTPFNGGPYNAEFGADGPGPIVDGAMKFRINAGQEPLTDTAEAANRAAYDAAVRYLDAATQRLFTILDDTQLLEQSVVILTSDHGEGLGDHAYLGHLLSIWEEQLDVPLIVRHPGAFAGGTRVAGPRSLTQIAGSSLAWLDLAVPEQMARRPTLESEIAAPADYRSYFDPAFPNTRMTDLYPDLAARVGHSHVVYCLPYKLFVHSDDRIELFDLRQDPRETINVAETEPEAARQCFDRYREVAGGGAFIPFDADLTTDLIPDTPQDLEALRALGYIR
jgi:arylsulfatase A-like enzyme